MIPFVVILACLVMSYAMHASQDTILFGLAMLGFVTCLELYRTFRDRRQARLQSPPDR